MGPKPNQSGAQESGLGKSTLHMTSGHLKWFLNGHIIQTDPVRILLGHLKLNGKLGPPVVILPPRKKAYQRSELPRGNGLRDGTGDKLDPVSII